MKVEAKAKKILMSICFLLLIGVAVFVCLYRFAEPKNVLFSKESGFYDQDVEVTMTPDGFPVLHSVEIKYNMNGDSLDNTSFVYENSIILEVPEEGYKLYTIMAAVCKKDGDCAEPKTMTYILGHNLEEDITLDVININCSQYNLYDYNVGIMAGGWTYDLNKTINPIYVEGNYNNRGKKWAKDAHITIFSNKGEIAHDVNGYIEISGGTSAAYDIKSMKVSIPLGDDENGWDIFRFRSGSQDQFSGNIRSSVVSRLVSESGFDGGATTQRVVVFLNGRYYGIFDKQSMNSPQSLVEKYNLEKKKYIHKIKTYEKNAFEAFGLSEDIWEDLDQPEKRENLEKIIDMDDYLQHYATQILINNTDWPMNNFEAWRYEGPEIKGNKYADGRIRFIIRDTDLIYYTEDNTRWHEGAIGDIFRFLIEERYNGKGSTFHKVMESDYYREKFINLLRELINGPFATENILKIVDEEEAKIDHQMKLFSTEEEYNEWKHQIELLRTAVKAREGEIRQDVWDYFKVKL